MTLQERYDAKKAEAASIGAEYRQVREKGVQLEKDMIRADAEMALLEALIKEDEASRG